MVHSVFQVSHGRWKKNEQAEHEFNLMQIPVENIEKFANFEIQKE